MIIIERGTKACVFKDKLTDARSKHQFFFKLCEHCQPLYLQATTAGSPLKYLISHTTIEVKTNLVGVLLGDTEATGILAGAV